MLCAAAAFLSCLPFCKAAGDTNNFKTVSYELTTQQPFRTQPPTTEQLPRQPTEETVSRAPPAEDDPDATLAAIEASIEPKQDHKDEDHKEAEQTTANINPDTATAPPNLELNIVRDPLPDFSLTSRTRLSYWGPSPFSPPDQPLPTIPAPAEYYEDPRHSPFYRSYLLGEETPKRILTCVRSNPRLNDSPRRSL